MAKYVVESEHTPEECLRTAEESKDVLDKFVFACNSGKHTGWAYVEAGSEKDALENVPEFIRGKANAYKVEHFTQEQVKAMHR